MYRKDLIPLLSGQFYSVQQIARLIDQSPRDTEGDLKHLQKSLKHTEFEMIVDPAECRKCGFLFGQEKFHKPSKCPECRSTWLTEPLIGISKRGLS